MADETQNRRGVKHCIIQTQIKENIKAPRHWPLCGEFTGTGEFPAQRANYAENVYIWWRHHAPSSRFHSTGNSLVLIMHARIQSGRGQELLSEIPQSKTWSVMCRLLHSPDRVAIWLSVVWDMAFNLVCCWLSKYRLGKSSHAMHYRFTWSMGVSTILKAFDSPLPQP